MELELKIAPPSASPPPPPGMGYLRQRESNTQPNQVRGHNTTGFWSAELTPFPAAAAAMHWGAESSTQAPSCSRPRHPLLRWLMSR